MSEANEKFPQTWKHKETGKICRATPWWEIPETEEILNLNPSEAIKAGLADEHKRRFKIGVLAQVGWLLENEHGVWMGVGIGAQEHFEMVENKNGKSG